MVSRQLIVSPNSIILNVHDGTFGGTFVPDHRSQVITLTSSFFRQDSVFGNRYPVNIEAQIRDHPSRIVKGRLAADI